MNDSAPVPLTPAGYEKLSAELARLKGERPKVIKAIEDARALGDLSENAEYHAAKERQGLLEAQIARLESLLSRAEVIDPRKFNDKKIRFGATVTLFDEDTGKEIQYQVVGEPESDVEHGKLSVTSPLGRALVGKEEGDDVVLNAPGGRRRFSVIKVEYK